MDITLITPPSEDDVLNLVTLERFRGHERITHTHLDDQIKRSIKSAYALLDGRYGWLNRSILTQEWKLWLPNLPRAFELPFGPLQSVEAISYYDTDGDLQTLDSGDYEVLPGEFVGCVQKLSTATYPTVATRARAVSIEFTAGFGDADTIQFPVRAALEQAILLLASHYYRNPSATYADPRVVTISRQLEIGLETLIGFLRVPPDHS